MRSVEKRTAQNENKKGRGVASEASHGIRNMRRRRLVQPFFLWAPLLKCLHLIDCHDITNEAFAEAITKFPLMEELELCKCYSIYDARVFEVVATACPRLKHFKHVEDEGYAQCNRDVYRAWSDARVKVLEALQACGAMAIARMQELRSLELFRCSLDGQGLTTILDNCLHLESLDIRRCWNITVLDSSLRSKCARVKTKKLYPYAFTDDWEHFQSGSHDDFTDDSEYFEPGSPISYCSSWSMDFSHDEDDNDERDCQVFFIAPCDSDDSDHSRYFSDADKIEFEEHDRTLSKGMRRCMRI